MTLNDIRQIDREYLLPREVADILGTDAQAIRVCARSNPAALGFPVVRLGTRIKVPRLPFLRFMEGGLN